MTPSLELPSDRQVMASISRRARDTALPENKLVLRPFPALSSTARTRPGVNGGKRESKVRTQAHPGEKMPAHRHMQQRASCRFCVKAVIIPCTAVEARTLD